MAQQISPLERVSKDRLKLSEQLTGLSEKSINQQQEQVKQWTLALKYYGFVPGRTDKIRGFEGLRQQGLSKDTTFIARAASLLSLSTAAKLQQLPHIRDLLRDRFCVQVRVNTHTRSGKCGEIASYPGETGGLPGTTVITSEK